MLCKDDTIHQDMLFASQSISVFDFLPCLLFPPLMFPSILIIYIFQVYSEDAKGPFPTDLEKLSRYVVKIALNVDFIPEAAIVNFYLMDSFLSGHVDRSELNTSAPLISLRFVVQFSNFFF